MALLSGLEIYFEALVLRWFCFFIAAVVPTFWEAYKFSKPGHRFSMKLLRVPSNGNWASGLAKLRPELTPWGLEQSPQLLKSVDLTFFELFDLKIFPQKLPVRTQYNASPEEYLSPGTKFLPVGCLWRWELSLKNCFFHQFVMFWIFLFSQRLSVGSGWVFTQSFPPDTMRQMVPSLCPGWKKRSLKNLKNSFKNYFWRFFLFSQQPSVESGWFVTQFFRRM